MKTTVPVLTRLDLTTVTALKCGSVVLVMFLSAQQTLAKIMPVAIYWQIERTGALVLITGLVKIVLKMLMNAIWRRVIFVKIMEHVLILRDHLTVHVETVGLVIIVP